MSGPVYHARTHRCNSPDGMPVLVHLKIFDDETAVTSGDDARRFVVTDDLGGTRLRSAHASVTTASTSGTVALQVVNLNGPVAGTVDLLSTVTSIDATEFTSYTGTVQHVVNTGTISFNGGTFPTNYIQRGDVLRIDIDAAGTGAKGLEALLEFGPPILKIS